MSVQLKRVYNREDGGDIYVILVDRLWPRGIAKKDAPFDLWLKEIAPSTELRKWFDHDPEKWEDFQEKYQAELEQNPEPFNRLKALLKKHRTICLTYAAADTQHNHAIFLKKLLEQK